jgi:hypothetical protein
MSKFVKYRNINIYQPKKNVLNKISDNHDTAQNMEIRTHNKQFYFDIRH